MRHPVLICLLAGAAAFGLSACQPTPPAQRGTNCPFITEEQNNAVQPGMDLAAVQAAVGNKALALTTQEVFAALPPDVPVIYDVFEWNLRPPTNGCTQNVGYRFGNGRLVSKSWSNVVK